MEKLQQKKQLKTRGPKGTPKEIKNLIYALMQENPNASAAVLHDKLITRLRSFEKKKGREEGEYTKMVENAFRIMLRDPKVKGVLINIFGGILRCDVQANVVVQAAEKTGISLPVVVRMEGTNVEEGRKILSESGLNLMTAVDLKDAAQKVAEIVKPL